jgi:hypothetical protein
MRMGKNSIEGEARFGMTVIIAVMEEVAGFGDRGGNLGGSGGMRILPIACIFIFPVLSLFVRCRHYLSCCAHIDEARARARARAKESSQKEEGALVKKGRHTSTSLAFLPFRYFDVL